ncbi:uncharacterized protein [Amphiura filiformis]|uniref:uncharacterized protein n=1 Tax=Amphiura filiformis TaxID=82378 RepID=UPI003B210297
MGNSQRTDSSVQCVKQYGTNVPSNRHDLQSSSMANYSMDSDEPQDKSKLVLSSGESDGTVGNKPTTLGEQFEASKAIEGKKEKSRKKKKKATDPEKIMQSPVAVVNDKVDDNFEDALSEFPAAPKKGLPSSDSLTSNEEFSSDTGGATGTRPTIASKMVDGTFHVDNSKTLPNADSESLGDDVTMTNCKKDEDKGEKEDNDTTQKNSLVQTTHVQHGKSDSQPKLSDTENDKMLSNNRNLFTMTAHSTDTIEISDPPFLDVEETNAMDDDGEFQKVMSSKKSRRLNRKTKGVSMEDKLYTHQNKQLDKDQLCWWAAGNSSA